MSYFDFSTEIFINGNGWKWGTLFTDNDHTETTPIVFNGKEIRYENNRLGNYISKNLFACPQRMVFHMVCRVWFFLLHQLLLQTTFTIFMLSISFSDGETAYLIFILFHQSFMVVKFWYNYNFYRQSNMFYIHILTKRCRHQRSR